MKSEQKALLAEYIEACNYPGRLDEQEVEAQLALYLGALGVERKIVRLRQGWTLAEHPSLFRYVYAVLGRIKPSARDARDARDARAARDAMDAMDARDARDAMAARDARAAMDAMAAMAARAAMDAMAAMAAMAAMDRFARWCIQSWGWRWWRFEMSWISTTHIGAQQLGSTIKWADPFYRAFVAGAWLLHWTDDTLYWAAKPVVLKEEGRRLHCEDGPALRSDVENLYFWHGVLVPAFVVTRPEWITIKHIQTETNMEVRRIMIERMGWERFCAACDMKVLHEDTLNAQFPTVPVSELVTDGQRFVYDYRAGEEQAQLLEAVGMADFEDRPLKFVKLTDPSTGRTYILRVAHNTKRAYQGVGASFGMTEDAYKKKHFHRHGDVMLRPLQSSTSLSIHS